MSASQNVNPVGWFEIYVDDMGRAKSFYESVFQIELQNMMPPGEESSAHMEMNMFTGDMTSYGATGALIKMEGMPAGQNSVMVYFSCEDCAAEEARVKEFGGSVERSKFSIGEHGFITVFKDTEGNMLGLHSQK